MLTEASQDKRMYNRKNRDTPLNTRIIILFGSGCHFLWSEVNCYVPRQSKEVRTAGVWEALSPVAQERGKI